MRVVVRLGRGVLVLALLFSGCKEGGPAGPSVSFTFQPSTRSVTVEAGGAAARVDVDVTPASRGGGCYWTVAAPTGIRASSSVLDEFTPGGACHDFALYLGAALGVEPGSYDTTLRGSQDGVLLTRTITVTVEPNREGMLASLEGTLMDTTGFEVSGARVEVSQAGSGIAADVTDLNGWYSIRLPAAGVYAVSLAGVLGSMVFADTVEMEVVVGENTGRDLAVANAHVLRVPEWLGSLTVDAGTEVDLPPLGWRVWSRSGCPDCSHWVVVGVDGAPAAAFQVARPGTHGDGGAEGSEELTITAPAGAGSYSLYAARFVEAGREAAEAAYAARFDDEAMRDREFLWVGTLRATAGSATSTITWTGGAGTTDWFAPANWDLARVPQAGDRVVIPDASDDVLFGRDGTAVPDVTIRSLDNAGTLQVGVGQLTLTEGGTVGGTLDVVALESIDYIRPTLVLGEPVSVDGAWRCDGGRLKGARLDLEPASTSTMASTLPSALPGCQLLETTVANHGAMTTGPETVLFTTATLRNEADGTLEVSASQFDPYNCGSATCPDAVVNLGTLSAVSAGLTRFGVRLVNEGTVEVRSSLILDEGIEHSGILSGPSGAVGLAASSTLAGGSTWTSRGLAITGGETYALDGEISVESMWVDGGAAVSFGAAADLAGMDFLTVIDASAGFATGGEVGVRSLTVQGTATITVSAGTELRVPGTLTWQGGTFTGAGTTTVAKRAPTDPEARAQLSGLVADLSLDGHTLRIHGRGALDGDVQAGNDAVFEIRAAPEVGSGYFEVTADGDFLGTALGGSSVFRNYGTVQKTGGTDVTLIRACYEDGGVGVTGADPGTGVIQIEIPEGCS